MSKGWLDALTGHPLLRGRVAVIGLVDIDLSAAERRRADYALNDAGTGSDLDAMLTKTRPDLVFDIALPSTRRDLVLTALRHGCHVLTEKPMAASMDEARDILAAAKAAGRVHAVVQNRRFIPGVRRIRRLIDTGALGDLTALHADFFIGAHFGGFREQMQDVLLLDMAIHTLDAARFMANADPLAVYCVESNPAGSWYAHGAAADAIFEMSDGVRFTYRGSWVAEGAPTSWESAWRIVGTRGTLLWDGHERFDAHVVNGESGFQRPLAALEVLPPPDDAHIHGHASVIADFLDAIAAGRAPETGGDDNIKSLAMVFGAIESARLRARVPVDIQETR
ncbi:MAG: Gfo/Idh/MocA family oxidoreductase [Hyphomicrobiales bacterium]|nr:MAG: Gfo/Idh/MocA family oxidoreductase [Hyphomicrobiales bacterium]